MRAALRGLRHAALVFAGLPAAARGSLADGSALVQASLARSGAAQRGAGVEAAWEAKLHKEALASGRRHPEAEVKMPVQLISWPRLGDVWGDVKEGANNLTEQVGDVMGDTVGRVPAVRNEYSEEVTIIAEALSDALDAIRIELDTLLNETIEDKYHMIEKLGGFQREDLPTLLTSFEVAVTELLGTARARWSIVQDAIDRAVASVASGLEAARQTSLSRNLRLNIQVAQRKVGYFLRALSDAKDQIKGAGEMPLGTLGDNLLTMNTKLNEGLQYLGHFVTLFQQAFMDLMDTISNAVLWSKGDVNKIFGSVQHDVTDVAWRARSASRELVLGTRSVLAGVARRVGVQLPAWEPVSMPLLQSSAPTRRGLLPLLVALGLGALGLRRRP